MNTKRQCITTSHCDIPFGVKQASNPTSLIKSCQCPFSQNIFCTFLQIKLFYPVHILVPVLRGSHVVLRSHLCCKL